MPRLNFGTVSVTRPLSAGGSVLARASRTPGPRHCVAGNDGIDIGIHRVHDLPEGGVAGGARSSGSGCGRPGERRNADHDGQRDHRGRQIDDSAGVGIE